VVDDDKVDEKDNSEKEGDDEEGLGEDQGEDEELGEELADMGAEGGLMECIEVVRKIDTPHEQSTSASSQGLVKRKDLTEGKFSNYNYFYY
jgi:hypothetical protein